MARKRKKVAKTGAVWHQSAEEATLAKMPRYDAWACGHGPHGTAGYARAKEKRAWQKQMRQEGARTGSFLFFTRQSRPSRARTRLHAPRSMKSILLVLKVILPYSRRPNNSPAHSFIIV